MKKQLIFLLLPLFCSLFAIDGQVLTTLSRNLEDQWLEILPGRPPMVNIASQVVRKQPFQIRIFFRNPMIADSKANVDASLKITRPDGTVLHQTQKDVNLYHSACTSSQNLLLSPFHIAVDFEPADKTGTYRIDVVLKDRNSGKTTPLKTTIELVDQLPVKGKKTDWQKLLKEYYVAQRPELVLPAFQEMLNFMEQQKKAKKNINPLPMTASFFFILQDNPQLWNDFFRLTDSLPHNQKLHAAGIINSLGPEAVRKAESIVGSDTKSLLNRRAVNLFKVDRITRPVHLDILWCEFFARGTVAPLRKIIHALNQLQNSMSPEKFKELKAPTKQDQENLMKALIGRAALWSLSSNARQHKLVFFYLEGLFLRKRTGTDFTQGTVGLILKKMIEEQESKKAQAENSTSPEKSQPPAAPQKAD